MERTLFGTYLYRCDATGILRIVQPDDCRALAPRRGPDRA